MITSFIVFDAGTCVSYTALMRMLVRVIIFVFALTALTGVWSQDKDNENRWEDYQPRTLQSIIDMHHDGIENLDRDSQKKAMFITADNFPSQISLVYLGKSRSLPPNKGTLLQAWRRTLGEAAPPPDAFPTEVLFREGTHQNWIAVQKPLLDLLPKEVKRGQTINGYVIWIGAIRAAKHWEWLFAMNEFEPPHGS